MTAASNKAAMAIRLIIGDLSNRRIVRGDVFGMVLDLRFAAFSILDVVNGVWIDLLKIMPFQ